MESYSDLDDEGSGLELLHVSDVFDYLGEYTFATANGSGCESVRKDSVLDSTNTFHYERKCPSNPPKN